MSEAGETNKTVVRTFFARLNAGDVDSAVALFGEEGEWWVAGQDGPGSTQGMAQIGEQFRWVLTGPGKGLQFTERGILAEDDKVVVEMIGSGPLTTGKEYRNRYCFVLTVRQGAIVGAHEYMDTAHASSAFSAQ